MFNRKKKTIENLKNNIKVINEQKIELRGENIAYQKQLKSFDDAIDAFRMLAEVLKEENKLIKKRIKLIEKQFEELYPPLIKLDSQSPMPTLDDTIESAIYVRGDDSGFTLLSNDEQLKPKKETKKKGRNNAK